MFASIWKGFWLSTWGILLAVCLIFGLGVGYGRLWGVVSASNMQRRKNVLLYGTPYAPVKRNFLHRLGDAWNRFFR